MTVGQRLKELRGNYPITRLADKFGVPYQSIWRHEQDISYPSPMMRKKYIARYGKKAVEIFEVKK